MLNYNAPEEERPFQICSQEYLQFYKVISSEFKTDEDAAMAICRELPVICKPLNIGKFYLMLHAPVTRFSPEGQDNEKVMYLDDLGYDETGLQRFRFDTGEGGIFLIEVYPKMGTIWTEQDVWQLRFLATNIYATLGRVRMMRLLTDSISRDMMTGALNTPGIMRYGGMLNARHLIAKYVGIFFNIKNFKYINQSAGGRKGDEILVRYTRELLSHLQEGERLSRPGGDNFFALILKENADEFLDLLRELPIRIQSEGGEKTFLLSSNAGIYSAKDGDDLGKIMNCATVALNVAKHTDQAVDQLWFHPSMQERIMREKRVSQLFPHALRKQEFLVYYQPKVSLSTGELCGCEALVRWMHEGSLIPPMDFVPVLEKEGTVCSLDFYVFDRVCSDLRNWLDQGIKPVRVSVNFSQQHLRSLDLAERIEAIMEYYRIDSSLIEIELTELSGVKNHDSMMAFLKRMHNKGICTSIDDFGTGYSSLSMLREFEMDIIKLDKSFLDHIALPDENCRPDEIVIENIVRMAQSLELEIISEGVERKEQADFLRQIHCNMAQGFLFDKPLPHDEFESRLNGKRFYEIPEIS